MNFEKNILINGTNIIVDNLSPYDIFIGISDKGFDYDNENEMTGLSHLFEHLIFRHRGENENLSYNGSTCFNYITFYNKRKNNSISFEDVCKNLIFKFYNEYNNKPFIHEFDFDNKLRKVISELDNEYYFRKSYDMDGISLFLVNYGKKYLGGTIKDLIDEEKVKIKLIELWENIDPSEILIILKNKDKNIINLINKTFGSKTRVRKAKRQSNSKKPCIQKTLKGFSCILTKCENDFNISIKVDNTKECLKGLFMLTTLGVRVNCVNNIFYISISFDRNPLGIINYLYHGNEKELITNILENNDKRVYIEDIFHFHKYTDAVDLLEDYLYESDYIDKYTEYLYPVVRNIKKNIPIFGNLIINTPPDNILVNTLDTNDNRLFITEILLDIDTILDNKKEILKVKRKKNNKGERTSSGKISVKMVYMENYEFNFARTMDNYCYMILFYINNNKHNIRIDSNLKILGDKYDIRDTVRRIKSECMINEYIYKDLCPSFYEILFQFYLFDRLCPDIYDIIKKIKKTNYFRYINTKNDLFKLKNFPLFEEKKTYYIRTEYDFLITVTWLDNSILYEYILNYLKDIGLLYSMNMYETDEYVMFFNLTTNPDMCCKRLDDFITSYGDIDVTYIVSNKSRKLNLDDIIL